MPRLQPPGIDTLLGTDGNGRDIFSRLMTGATVSLPLALMLVIAAMIIGTLIGALAGYFGGWVDETLMRITDLFMAFPTVILAMVVTASLGPSLFNAVIEHTTDLTGMRQSAAIELGDVLASLGRHAEADDVRRLIEE